MCCDQGQALLPLMNVVVNKITGMASHQMLMVNKLTCMVSHYNKMVENMFCVCALTLCMCCDRLHVLIFVRMHIALHAVCTLCMPDYIYTVYITIESKTVTRTIIEARLIAICS